MRVLVAGATGLVGGALLPALRARGHHVVAMVRDGAKAADATLADDAVVADALDPHAVRAAVRTARPDVVVHQLTALREMSNESLETTARLRTEGTANLITAAREVGARKFVAQSIAFGSAPQGEQVVDEDAPLYLNAPDPSWGRTVRAVAELERLVLGTPDISGVILRYGALYGANTQYDPAGPFGARVGRGRLPLPSPATGMTSFLHLEDAVAATVSAVDGAATGVFHITDDEPVEGAVWLPEYARLIGAPTPRVLDGDIAQRLLGWFTHYQLTALRGASNKRAREVLGWKPVWSWRQGLVAG